MKEKFRRLLEKTLFTMFPKTFKVQRADMCKLTCEMVAKNIRDELTWLGWKCDADMDAVVYAEKVEKVLERMIKTANKSIKDLIE